MIIRIDKLYCDYRFLFALIKNTETIAIITASVSDAISCPMAAAGQESILKRSHLLRYPSGR